jgi:hypothetical protein
MGNGQARVVEEQSIRSLDFSATSLAVGIELAGKNPPWLQLDEADLRILVGLLRSRFSPSAEAATEASEPLRLLAVWCDAAADWLRAH